MGKNFINLNDKDKSIVDLQDVKIIKRESMGRGNIYIAIYFYSDSKIYLNYSDSDTLEKDYESIISLLVKGEN